MKREYSDDAPIDSADDDRFDTRHFAQQIAHVISKGVNPRALLSEYTANEESSDATEAVLRSELQKRRRDSKSSYPTGRIMVVKQSLTPAEGNCG